MSRLGVVHVIPTLDQSGAEKQLALLAAGLPRDRYDVTVLALTRGGHYEQVLRDAGVAVEVIGKRFKGDPFALFRLTKRLKALKPTIVQTWLFAGNTYGRLAARWAKVPRVVASERCVDSWKSGLQLMIDRRLAPKTDLIAVNSNAVRSFYAHQGVDAAKLRVVPNAAPAAPPIDSVEARKRIRAELGLPSDAYVAGFVGRLWPQKRVDDLIWAADVVRLAERPIHVVVAGDGPRREALERFSNQLKMTDLVHFLGHRKDAAELMHAFDVFVLPSDFEGMPNVVLEAMQAGLPVVATRIPGLDEVVKDGETGVLVAPRSPIELARALDLLFREPETRARFGAAGKQRVETEFTVERMVQAYASLYEELAGRGG